MNNYDLTPMVDCSGCKGTAGRLGCTKHSPFQNINISDQPKPFALIFLRCPHCGKDMRLDCFKLELMEDKTFL